MPVNSGQLNSCHPKLSDLPAEFEVIFIDQGSGEARAGSIEIGSQPEDSLHWGLLQKSHILGLRYAAEY